MTNLQPPDGVPASVWAKLARQEGNRWAISERDANGEVIGTAYRDANGGKDFKRGGKRGLIVAWPLDAYAGTTIDAPIFVCEGASDTAAVLGLDLDAVGVPMAGQCGPMVAELLADRHAVIVADGDGAGRRGAMKITKPMAKRCASVRTVEPPMGAKDARAAVIAGVERAAFLEAARVAKSADARPQLKDDAPDFAPVSAFDLIRSYPELRPIVIADLLREGETMNVVAAPKVGKSWLIHGLALAVVSGRDWLGKPTAKGRVLLIDGELHRETLAKRLGTTQTALGIANADLRQLEVWPVRGQGWTIDTIADRMEGVPTGHYRLIVVDALYRFLPHDMEENSNETITHIYNLLDQIARNSVASVAIVHHASKGNQSEKSITDVGSGAGAQSRAADTHLVLRPHEEDDAVVVEAAVRSFPPTGAFVIRSTKPGWSLAPDLDPTDLRKNARRAKRPEVETTKRDPIRAWTPDDFAVEVIGPVPIVRDEVIAKALTRGMRKSEAEAMLKRAVDAGKVNRRQAGPSEPYRFSIDPPNLMAKQRGGSLVS